MLVSLTNYEYDDLMVSGFSATLTSSLPVVSALFASLRPPPATQDTTQFHQLYESEGVCVISDGEGDRLCRFPLMKAGLHFLSLLFFFSTQPWRRRQAFRHHTKKKAFFRPTWARKMLGLQSIICREERRVPPSIEHPTIVIVHREGFVKGSTRQSLSSSSQLLVAHACSRHVHSLDSLINRSNPGRDNRSKGIIYPFLSP
jgi:hypothetical protein